MVELYKYSTFSKVFHLALKVENQLKKKQEVKRNTPYNDYYSRKGNERKDERTTSKSLQKPPPKGYSTRVSNDKSKSKSPSSHTHPSTSQRLSSIKCFKCLGYKHITLNGPAKRTMILKNDYDVESEHFSYPFPKSTSSPSSSSIERTKTPWRWIVNGKAPTRASS